MLQLILSVRFLPVPLCRPQSEDDKQFVPQARLQVGAAAGCMVGAVLQACGPYLNWAGLPFCKAAQVPRLCRRPACRCAAATAWLVVGCGLSSLWAVPQCCPTCNPGTTLALCATGVMLTESAAPLLF